METASKIMDTRRLVYGGVFTAAGVLLPQIFHMVGGSAMGGCFCPCIFPYWQQDYYAGQCAG